MTRPRYEPDDAREWVNRAQSTLAYARQLHPDVLFEDLCYSAQQAAEKAIQAVFVKRNQPFPFTHNLDRLLSLLQRSGVSIPDPVLRAGVLTPYAVVVRYPGPADPVSEDAYLEAIAIAASVVEWAEFVVHKAANE